MLKKPSSLKDRISSRKGRIAIIGIGYVGLPLAVRLAEEGFRVLGVDRSLARIDAILQGKSVVEGLSDRRVGTAVRRGRLKPVHVMPTDAKEKDLRYNPEVVKQFFGIDIFIICVHTPLRKGKGWEPDLRWIRRARRFIEAVCQAEEKADCLPQERLIILESTTYPGTTRTIFKKLVRDFGERHDLSWYLAYSPERTDPGPKAHILDKRSSAHRSRSKIPRVVGGLDLPSRDIAMTLYQELHAEVEPVESLETGEMVKLVENTFRFVSIGFANEMARIAKAFDLNVWEIIRAAKTKGFGLDLCYPGLIGGHCIPIDPHYLDWAVRRRRLASAYIGVAERTQQQTRTDALGLIRRLLNQQMKGLYGARILFFGVAYKRNVSDFRESPSLDLMKQLFARGAEISFWDPMLTNEATREPLHLVFTRHEWRALPSKVRQRLMPAKDQSERLLYLELHELRGKWQNLRTRVLSSNFDCVVLATDHDCFQRSYRELILTQGAPPLADLRNAVGTWLQRQKRFAASDLAELKDGISTSARYMLLGRD